MTPQEKAMQSARFKHDFVTLAAVGLFVFTVIFELGLAISIPMTFSNANLYAEQEARQRTLDRFDYLRQIAKSPGPSEEAKAPKMLIEWDLNLLKNYLAKHSSSMSMKEISDVSAVLEDYAVELNRCQNGEQANMPYRLDLTPVTQKNVDALEKLANDIGKNILEN